MKTQRSVDRTPHLVPVHLLMPSFVPMHIIHDDLSILAASTSATAMHPCLRIQELISLICDCLDGQRRDLLSMLLICQAFKEPALDHLWRRIEGVDPLLCCFPDDVVTRRWEKVYGEDRMRWTLIRAPQPSDWIPVLSNTARVRSFRLISWDSWGEFCSEIFLRNPNFQGTLFPKLYELDCDSNGSDRDDRDVMRFGRAIASSRPLRHLEYSFDTYDFPVGNLHADQENEDEDGDEDRCEDKVGNDSEHEAEGEEDDESEDEDETDSEDEDEGPRDDLYTRDLAQCLQASRTSLTRLKIDTANLIFRHNVTMRPFRDISKAVCQLHALQTADIYSPLDSHALSHLAHLQGLTSLSLYFPMDDFPLPQAVHPDPNNFGALTHLEITTFSRSLKLAVAFFDNILPPNLQTLTTVFDWEPRVSGLTKLVCSIGRFTSLHTIDLTTTSEETGGDWEPLEEEQGLWPVPFDIFAPLYQISELRDLRIATLPIVIEPRDIRIIADAWPRLEALDLNPSGELNRSSVEIPDVRPLVVACPLLKLLGISLCGRRNAGYPIELPEARSVKTLYVGWPCADRQPRPEDDAALKEMFPNARVVCLCSSGQGEQEDGSEEDEGEVEEDEEDRGSDNE